MGKVYAMAFALAVSCGGTETAMAQVWDRFDAQSGARWDYVADGVMGGVSQGRAELVPGEGAVRLVGEVSTENNGGFIQVRRRFEGGWPDDTQGLRLSVRGNGETYYVFLRTGGLRRVWHSYSAAFVAGAQWSEVTLPLDGFVQSHVGMDPGFAPGDVVSIGIVAYGRDHVADLMVREIRLY